MALVAHSVNQQSQYERTNKPIEQANEKERERKCAPRALVCVYVTIAPLIYKHTEYTLCHVIMCVHVCMWKRRPLISIDKNSFLFLIKDFLVVVFKFATTVCFTTRSLSLSLSCSSILISSYAHFIISLSLYLCVCVRDLLCHKGATECIRKALNLNAHLTFPFIRITKSGIFFCSFQTV